MKCVVAWKLRYDGSAAENEASAAWALEVYSKWTQASETTIHQFVIRVDGQGVSRSRIATTWPASP